MLNSQNIIEQSSSFLLSTDHQNKEKLFTINDYKLNKISIEIDLNNINDRQTIVLFNPSANQRNEIISLKVNSPFVKIYNENGEPITSYSISLIWQNTYDLNAVNINEQPILNSFINIEKDFEKNYCELVVSIRLEALSFTRITIVNEEKSELKLTKVQFYNKIEDEMYFNNFEANFKR